LLASTYLDKPTIDLATIPTKRAAELLGQLKLTGMVLENMKGAETAS
jgi:hypothetical protein